MSYQPDTLYDDTDLGRYVKRELQKISDQSQLNAVEVVEFKVWHTEPDKPRQGQVYYADGTDWTGDGVSGEGLYRYNGSAWVFVG